MITYEKILVCLDQTDIDSSVLRYACDFSKVAGTKEIVFLNVIKDFNLPEAMIKEFPNLIEQAVQERRAELQEAIGSFFDCDQIKTEILISQGNATKEILSTSIEFGADLIVLGKRKGSDSVLSTRIVRRAACNILMVPQGADFKLDRIHVPVDFSNYSELSLQAALTLSANSESEIFVQNVYNVPSSYRYSGKTFEEFAAIMEENSGKDLDFLIRQVSPKNQTLTPVHTRDDGQNIIKMIFEDAASKKAQLIIMGAKGRTAASALFIGSKAERMISVNESIPLIVVRPKGANAGIIESLQDL